MFPKHFGSKFPLLWAINLAYSAIVTGGLVAMVEVHGKHSLREDFFGLSNYNFQHPFVGIFPCVRLMIKGD
jgi:hypothetical protein